MVDAQDVSSYNPGWLLFMQLATCYTAKPSIAVRGWALIQTLGLMILRTCH